MLKPDITIDFGHVVRRHRQSLKLSQEALGEAAGIHATHVSLIERGQRSASLRVAKAIAIALDQPLNVLVLEAEAVGRRGQ